MKTALRALCLILALPLLMSGCASGPMIHAPRQETIHGTLYDLTFEDDFEGDALDRNKWEYCPDWERGDLDPRGRWDRSMVAVEDGNLVLTAALNEDGVPISGAISTEHRFSQQGGYFECRCQLQQAPGFWGAFWLMDPKMRNVAGNGAEDGAEIDIMESFDIRQGGVNHAIHWDGYGSEHQSVGQPIYDLDLYRGYHVFALAWTQSEYIFYIDGEETYRTSEPGMCQNPLYLLLTIEFGTWAGRIQEAGLPDRLLVDYVRVWQRAE